MRNDRALSLPLFCLTLVVPVKALEVGVYSKALCEFIIFYQLQMLLFSLLLLFVMMR